MREEDRARARAEMGAGPQVEEVGGRTAREMAVLRAPAREERRHGL